MKAGSETGSVFNHIMTESAQPVPLVGLGATICMWSDRKATTIIEVHPNKKGVVKEVIIQEDTATRTDTNGMSDSQTYSYQSNPEGRKHTVKLLKSGWRVLEGRDGYTKRNIYGSGVVFGVRRHYHDYSF
jgi:hypothetical protein